MNSILSTFVNLIYRDMSVYIPTYKDRFINGLLWFAFVVLVFEYIMAHQGLKDFGVFIAISSVGSWGFFSVMNFAGEIISDLEGERSITYYLTLPIPQWMVFARIAISNALQAMMIAVLFIPMTKLFLWKQFNLGAVIWWKFIIAFFVTHIFYGFMSLFLASCIKSFQLIENVWMRVVWPIWYLGCYQFTWQSLYQTSPYLAYASLINPMVYIMEALRSSAFGQEGSLPFWPCIGMVILFTVFFGILGITRLKKRLDCL